MVSKCINELDRVTHDNLPQAITILINESTNLKTEVRELKKLIEKTQFRVQPVKQRITADINRVMQITNLGKSSIYSKRRKKEFPGGMQKGQKILWYEDQIFEWIESGKVKTLDEIDAAADAAIIHK